MQVQDLMSRVDDSTETVQNRLESRDKCNKKTAMSSICDTNLFRELSSGAMLSIELSGSNELFEDLSGRGCGV